jgi:hypothetical protein
MQTARATLATLLLVLSLSAPARADFKYTETSQVTGGSLVSVMKVAGIFARGDTKKQEQQMMQPTSTTHAVKGNRLRTDNADGTSEIIDLEGQRVIAIDNNKKTYAVATFQQIRDAMQQAMQNAQAQAKQSPDPNVQNPQLNITPKITVTPGTGNRVILSQSTNETKVLMEITMEATGTGPNAPPPGQPNSATMTTNMDTFVAPSVSGYQEFAEFYRHMAQQANWVVLPSNIHVDPRVSQSMASLQQNSDALKGFPLLSYVNMSMALAGQPQQDSQTPAQNQNSAPPPNNNSSGNASSNSSSTIDSPSTAIAKGLGGLFGKKKQSNQTSGDQSGSANQASAPPPNPNANSNDLIEITTQVTTFSDSSLDGSFFDVPAGYTQTQADPTQVMAGRASPQQPAGK